MNTAKNSINTGFSEIDYFLSGLEKGSLVAIGARPSMGKTTFAMTLAENFLKKGKKCLYFSVEISLKQFMQLSSPHFLYQVKRQGFSFS